VKSAKLGPLHRRGSTYYCFLPSSTAYGRGPERSLKTKDLSEAKLAYEKLLTAFRAGELANDREQLSLAEACTSYLRHREIRLRPGSFKSERSIVKRLSLFFTPAITLRQVAHLAQLRGYQSARSREGASPKSINNELQVMRRILQDANLWTGELQRLYRPLRVLASDLPTELSQTQALALHSTASRAAEDEAMPLIAVLAYHTGMRAGEIRQLRLGDIELTSHAHIRISRGNTKTDRGARWVPLDRTAIWCLQKLMRRAQMLGSHMARHYLLPRLVHMEAGKSVVSKYDPTAPCATWERAWRTLKKKCLLECRFHDLRHSYVSNAARAGVRVSVLQDIVGHMDARMTRWYTHVSQSDFSEATRLMELHQQSLQGAIAELSNGPVGRLQIVRSGREKDGVDAASDGSSGEGLGSAIEVG